MLTSPSVPPLEIGMVIHYCTIAQPYSAHCARHRYSQAVTEITERWLRLGYLKIASALAQADGLEYEATEALHVWMHALCCVPRPVQKWVIPE